MPRSTHQFTPKVITANALLEGDVVYLTERDCWTRDLREAALLTDEADAELRLLQAEAQTGVVVGAYLAEMTAGTHGPEPVHFRERFRRNGPSNYLHGKQERI
ncbi:DUF2849 domain-containing protein [Planktotalea arctica]|uniref:DUF2849 domain-containing protein n=1 Tax=Planktotalea arctica TaxID=1481893 RepID=UPI00321B0620